MKVAISVGGKFHAFHLARQLQLRGHLDRIFTSYPWFAVKHSKVPRDKVSCLFLKEILDRGGYKIPYLNKRADIANFVVNFFDKQVARRIRPCDIFVCSAAYSLHTIREVRRKFSAKVIIDKVSSHIQVYRDILREEYERLGIKLKMPFSSAAVIEKELQEYREADYITVPFTFARNTFLNRNFPENKIICVSSGVDTETFRPVPKNDSAFRIITVGMRVIKGMHYLLQAVDELNLKDLELWLIGGNVDETLRPFLKKYSKIFRYLGAIPQSQLYKYYSQGSLFVVFSLEDGAPYSLLEAMACGLPVICSDSVGAKDIVRNNIDGFIIPTRDIEALKEKIIYLYENQDACREMGRQAQENVVKNFTWDNYGEKIVNIYLDLLK